MNQSSSMVLTPDFIGVQMSEWEVVGWLAEYCPIEQNLVCISACGHNY